MAGPGHEILHFETITNHCTLVFTGEASPQGFLGGAGFRPSTVLKILSFQGKKPEGTEAKPGTPMSLTTQRHLHGIVVPLLVGVCSPFLGKRQTWAQ